MRSLARVSVWVTFLLLFATLAAGDIAVRPDGSVVRGQVARVVFVDGRTVDKPVAVHLDADRELLDLRALVANHAFVRARPATPRKARVAVYMGTGAFAPSAQAVVRRLDELRIPVRFLFGGEVRDETLAGLRAVVFPGGWAPSMLTGLGEGGQAALAKFVRGGGRYLGICAGGYLPCARVRWGGTDYPYPVGLAAGTADGPVAGLAPWPGNEVVTLRRPKNGGPLQSLYAGGASFDVKGARVLARYSSGAPAAIEVAAGRGRLVLVGTHPEFDSSDGPGLLAWAGNPKGLSAKWFKQVVAKLLK